MDESEINEAFDEGVDFSEEGDPFAVPAGGDVDGDGAFGSFDAAEGGEGVDDEVSGYAAFGDEGEGDFGPAPDDGGVFGDESAPDGGFGEDITAGNGDDDDADPFSVAQAEMPPSDADDIDGAPLREFNAKFREEMDEKDRIAREERAVIRAEAKKEIETFVEQLEIKKAAKKKSNREAEVEFLKTIEEAKKCDNSWERVLSLVDVSTNPEINERDISRLRQVLIQLKSHPIAAFEN